MIIRFCCFCFVFFQIVCSQALADLQGWQNIDEQVKTKIFQINVGINIRLKNGAWAVLTDLSAKQHYYVFTTTPKNPSYQIVGHGSCFPLATTNKQKTFFVTSEHVLDEAAETIEECEMFYAAMQMYAIERSLDGHVESRIRELLAIVNLGGKQNMSIEENTLYSETVDAIWDYYDLYLSPQVDPKRVLYNKYKKLAGVQAQIAYFLHAPGSALKPTLEGKVYKIATNHKLDLAILTIQPNTDQDIAAFSLDTVIPHRDQQIQVAGYPVATQTVETEPTINYAPNFTSGKIIKVMPNTFEFDAFICNGNSGGPVLNNKGEVLGVVTSKEPVNNKTDNYGIAINAQSIKILVPELFKNNDNAINKK